MAGLPHAVSSVLNDTVLTFLNRAPRVELGLISTNLIRAYYERAFRTMGIGASDEMLDRAAMARVGGTVTTAKLLAVLGRKGPAIQTYRKRLIEGGVIESPRRGELVFAVPYLADYLLKENDQ